MRLAALSRDAATGEPDIGTSPQRKKRPSALGRWARWHVRHIEYAVVQHEDVHGNRRTVPGNTAFCRLYSGFSRSPFPSGDAGRVESEFAGSFGNAAGGWRAEVADTVCRHADD